MKVKILKHIDLLIERYPVLASCKGEIINAYNILEECFSTGCKLLIAGNGGSCADSAHIVGELMKGFKLTRKCTEEFADRLKDIDKMRGAELAERLQGGLPAIALTEHQSLNTAYLNDVLNGGLLTFAQQTYVYGQEGDILLAITTSGNSKNLLFASVVAKAKGMKIIALTGATGGEIAKFADTAIKVPEAETYMIQELHVPIYHCLCLMLEEKFFG
ncbi:MAG: SIS domain-containing protein [Clostridia bacterium]|nr:SIS domain-containing protein [Clostridia bacterium]